MESLFNDLTLTDYHGDLYRNIVSLRESQDLYDDLTDNPQGWNAAVDLELATKPHLYTSSQPVIDRPFEEAAYNEAIQYPFTHWSRTRYSDGSFGVWYGSDTLQTSIHETVYHWRTRLLEDAGWNNEEGVVIERKVYLVKCDAALMNFIPKIAQFPALIDTTNYHFTQLVGARIHQDGYPGLVSRSARCDGALYAVFNARVLSNPRNYCYLTYRNNGGTVSIERSPGECLMTI